MRILYELPPADRAEALQTVRDSRLFRLWLRSPSRQIPCDLVQLAYDFLCPDREPPTPEKAVAQEIRELLRQMREV